MSLTVYAYTVDQDDKMLDTILNKYWESADWREISQEERMRRVAVSGRGKHLAGPEVARKDLWGAGVMISLGLVLLPSLAHGDIYAVGDQLDLLQREVQTVLQNVCLIAEHTTYAAESISECARNIEGAIREARGVAGGVVIW